MFTRRKFITNTVTAAAALPFFNLNSFAGEDRPNFVFILTDDQRWDTMSCMGHPILHTPNLDRLAREGARFANAFCTTSLCSPSRASFLTGRYAHSHGVIDNQRHLDPSVLTFPQVLQKAGYNTAFIGKWHMSLQEDPQPGFDRWVSFPGQGVYNNPRLNIDGEKTEVTGYITDLLTDYALDWLKQPRKTPFCLYLSHKAVHSDFIPAIRHSKLYKDAKITPPKNMYDDLKDKPEWLKNVKRVSEQAEDYPEFVEKMKNYYRSLMAVDESVGRVLAELEKLGVLDNTVVVFAGDNGFFMGEHGLVDKRAMYEESLRIPILMRYPKLVNPGTVVDQMVLNIDICPTFLDLAGVKAPEGVDGKSVRPLLKGKTSGWRSDFLYEYFWEPEAKKRPTIKGIRTERWKYITYPDSENIPELYDLKNDPYELKNLANDPSSSKVLADMKVRMQRFHK